jgi:hypothetical protein
VKGAQPYKVAVILPQLHMLADHVNNVRLLPYLLDNVLGDAHESAELRNYGITE